MEDGEATAVAHLEEELGDLLFQVYFHATLAAEEGRFTLADVARGVHDKLVARHPHVFGDVTAETADDVATNWEAIKKAEKGRTSVTEGIPAALPALALAAKLQRKATAIGMVLPALADEATRVAGAVTRLSDRAAPTAPPWPTAKAGHGSGRRGREPAVRRGRRRPGARRRPRDRPAVPFGCVPGRGGGSGMTRSAAHRSQG